MVDWCSRIESERLLWASQSDWCSKRAFPWASREGLDLQEGPLKLAIGSNAGRSFARLCALAAARNAWANTLKRRVWEDKVQIAHHDDEGAEGCRLFVYPCSYSPSS